MGEGEENPQVCHGMEGGSVGMGTATMIARSVSTKKKNMVKGPMKARKTAAGESAPSFVGEERKLNMGQKTLSTIFLAGNGLQ